MITTYCTRTIRTRVKIVHIKVVALILTTSHQFVYHIISHIRDRVSILTSVNFEIVNIAGSSH